MSGKRAKAAFLRGVFVASLALACLMSASFHVANHVGANDLAKAGPFLGRTGPLTEKADPAQNGAQNTAQSAPQNGQVRERFSEPVAPRREILINIPAFTLYLYEEGRLIRQYPIAVGRMVTPSSFGEYRIINRVVDPTWYPEGREPVPPGPDNPIGTRWLGISLPGYGIHGTNDPGAIGKAVSKGCIRMRNEDVEELYELVRIGTPVKLAYETIVIGPDQAGEQYTITVYRDIYRKGTNTLAEARLKLLNLARQGVQVAISDEQLSRILRAATGKPETLPVDVEVLVGKTPVGRGAFWERGRLWLPLKPLAEAFGKETGASGVAVPLDEVERIFGVHSRYDQREGKVSLLVPVLYREGEPSGVNGFWKRGMLYFPVFELAVRLDVEIGWDPEGERILLAGVPVPVTIINNTFYVPFYAVKDLPLKTDIGWEEEY